MSYYGNNYRNYNRGGTGPSGNPQANVSGGCSRNGMEGASSRYSVNWDGQGHLDNVRNAPVPGRQTNNRSDLVGIENAVKTARDSGYDKVTIRTNSDYVIKGATEYTPKWQENGWKNCKGREVVNRQDFMRLNDASKGMEVTYEKVGKGGGKKY